MIEPGDIETPYTPYARCYATYWKIVVEPDPLARVVIVVAAFEVKGLP